MYIQSIKHEQFGDSDKIQINIIMIANHKDSLLSESSHPELRIQENIVIIVDKHKIS